MKKRLFLKSLQLKLILTILFFIFIPMIFLFKYSFSKTESFLEQKVSTIVADNLEQKGNQIESVCLDMTKLLNTITNDNVIYSSMNPKNYSTSDENAIKFRDLYSYSGEDGLKVVRVEKQLEYHKNNISFKYDLDVFILGMDGTIYTALDGFSNAFEFKRTIVSRFQGLPWIEQSRNNDPFIKWIAPFLYNFPDGGKGGRFISASVSVKNPLNNDDLGIVFVNVEETSIKEILGSTESQIYSLVDKQNGIIFSSDMLKAKNLLDKGKWLPEIPGIGKGVINMTAGEKKYAVHYYNIERFGWALVAISDYADIMKEITVLKNRIYVGCVIGFAIILLAGLVFILYITNPLKVLVRKIRNIQIGEYMVGENNKVHTDDMGDLIRSFEHMLKRIEELVKTVIDEQKKEHELRYEALRAQINPHFLFNTLNTIKWTAMMSGSNNVAKMISNLGKLLEASMNKGVEEITFREEFDLVQAYVLIQNARFSDKFVLRIIVMEEEICNFKVIRLLLQPIVENAIIHGLKNIKEDAVIEIMAKRDEDAVIIEIADNGKGMQEDEIDKVLGSGEALGTKQKFSGIGFKNVHERIRIKYGDSYGLSIQSQKNVGTRVVIRLPIIIAANEIEDQEMKIVEDHNCR